MIPEGNPTITLEHGAYATARMFFQLFVCRDDLGIRIYSHHLGGTVSVAVPVPACAFGKVSRNERHASSFCVEIAWAAGQEPSQRSLHNAPIFRLLLKVAVNGTHQCDFFNFWGTSCPNHGYPCMALLRPCLNVC